MSTSSTSSLEPRVPLERGSALSSGRTSAILQSVARLAALLVIFLGFGFLVPDWAFFKMGNVENILIQSAVYAMAGLGMTMIIISGGIDLAAGSTIALAMVVVAKTLRAGDTAYYNAHPVAWTLLAVILGTLAAAAVGFVEGLLITGLRLVPFIVTLGMMQVVRGGSKGLADNLDITGPRGNWLDVYMMSPVNGTPKSWQLFPAGVWVTLVMAVLAAGMLRYTKLGRRIFAIGSNEATARLCGVPVQWTKIKVYAIAGLFTGLAGALEFSRVNQSGAQAAMGYELYVIAACVIGGASLMGGVGTISGTMIGAVMIGTLNVGAGQVDWPKWVQEVVIGTIIIVAVALDQLRNRKAR